MPLNDVEKKVLSVWMEANHQRLAYLFDRWQDEKEYEEWSDYAMAMQKMVESLQPTFVILKYLKRPFGITFHPKSNSKRYIIFATAKHVGWRNM
jgi:hypothetical protein